MEVLLLQTDIYWQQPEKNRRHAENVIKESPDADIIVLPEMFTTGFCTSPVGVAEEANTETLRWMQQIASEKNAAVCGSVATIDNGRYYNRFYFVKPDGDYATYNKRHLFTYAGEDKEYEAGKERVIVEYKGVRILLQVCYDLRFPVFSRNRGDYDVAIYIASWPESRIEAWNTLLRARAIENVCYVVAVNRMGDDPGNHYCGGTTLIDYKGKDIVAAGYEKEESVCGIIDLQALNDFRKIFPALKDADDFTLI
ncbi:MAG: amidohydrolase [Prevotella sp.]|jgi:predicted amidohydrolase|nr:amidohydrolase [Prevotella sp.]